MLPPQPNQLTEDIASSAAASLWNVLDLIVKLPAPQAFERLKLFFEGAISTYKASERRTFFSPSEN